MYMWKSCVRFIINSFFIIIVFSVFTMLILLLNDEKQQCQNTEKVKILKISVD